MPDPKQVTNFVQNFHFFLRRITIIPAIPPINTTPRTATSTTRVLEIGSEVLPSNGEDKGEGEGERVGEGVGVAVGIGVGVGVAVGIGVGVAI